MNEEETKAAPQKDKVLLSLEQMLVALPENARQPIINLINKRKVELGLAKSDLLTSGYKLKKKKEKRVPQSKESKDSLRKIAMSVGRVRETKEIILHDIDVKEEPLKKSKKTIEEADSYKY
ncbi:MAG: hypothetical protein J5U17_07025 [Candidatus Methanoperedens sp.]|nr:hypothetical protein [Candidatus Methanoperedens sp.]MCE8429022.1 hypothetical protein [Candidatus Methanoperedens sp.]